MGQELMLTYQFRVSVGNQLLDTNSSGTKAAGNLNLNPFYYRAKRNLIIAQRSEGNFKLNSTFQVYVS